ncbi:hypothetical protein SUDANB176_00729 [Streptomyces sp. enrichment culture]|uniref:hypothetical protein n=1 Tax=Streptomyces sp. enrichment culture TaxID=1795815 RepID=UPI003F574452
MSRDAVTERFGALAEPRETGLVRRPGTGNPGHLAENVAAGALRLTDEGLSRLDGTRRSGR